jgi:hypothetical protein
MTDKFISSGIVVAIIAALVFFLAINTRPSTVIGSVAQTEEYSRVNIAASAAYGATTTPNSNGTTGGIKVGTGAFGSVIIEGAVAGTLNFYDATTTDVTRRTGNKATSTILLASLPSSLVAGTYVFDEAIQTGLFVEILGTAPTTTVTFR